MTETKKKQAEIGSTSKFLCERLQGQFQHWQRRRPHVLNRVKCCEEIQHEISIAHISHSSSQRSQLCSRRRKVPVKNNRRVDRTAETAATLTTHGTVSGRDAVCIDRRISSVNTSTHMPTGKRIRATDQMSDATTAESLQHSASVCSIAQHTKRLAVRASGTVDLRRESISPSRRRSKSGERRHCGGSRWRRSRKQRG